MPELNLDPHFLSQTHQVSNQAQPLENYNSYEHDTALRDLVSSYHAGWAEADLLAHGAKVGSKEVIDWGFLANENKPVFHSHDRYGQRIDFVQYHDSYHHLMALGQEAGLHSSPWVNPRLGAHAARAAKYYLQAQAEAGHGCPTTMTFSSIPALRLTPALAKEWLPKILHNSYDPRNVPHFEKQSLTIGMGMTEKQGGSDVRTNTTQAYPLGVENGKQVFELVGHKWFTSAPMCDAYLMLAYSPVGLSCFLVPRWRDDGSKNPMQIQRLKNKVGNWSNASSEIELRGALGWLVGEEGKGVRAILEMVAMTRFDCMIGSSAGQRQAVAQALNHCQGREVFAAKLIDQPLMQNVLADLQLEVEGSLAMTMRMAAALDNSAANNNEEEQLLLRLGLAAGKYWICKRTPNHAYEAMECFGGNGAIEDFIMARLYREAPINAIWEGSGNVQALDMLRALERSPAVLDAWYMELAHTQGQNALLDKAVERLYTEFKDLSQAQYRARTLIEQLALTMQASLLLRSNADVGEAFIASRLDVQRSHNYGNLPTGLNLELLLQRADPWRF